MPLPWKARNELIDSEVAAGCDMETLTPLQHDRSGIDGGGEGAAAAERSYLVPVPPGHYRRLACAMKGRLLLWGPARDELHYIELPKAAEHKNFEPSLLLKGVKGDFCVSPNGERVLVHHHEGDLYIVSVVEDRAEMGRGQRILLSDIRLRTDPPREWHEIFCDAWRQARDTFWDPKMGAVDWGDAFVRYGRLLPRVADREDLAQLIRLLYSELRVLHLAAVPSSIAKRPTQRAPHAAFLGAVLEANVRRNRS